MSYLLAFLAFAALITLHEAGHFAAAKAVGMRVEKFSLFFGPMIFKKQIGETVYGVGTIPLGGYVKITGMSELEIIGPDAIEDPELAARAYFNQPVWKRIVVIAAGPAVNLVLAFALILAFVMSQNYDVVNTQGQSLGTLTVGKVLPGSAAVGVLRAGDQLVSIDRKPASTTTIAKQISAHDCAGGAKVNGCVATTPVTFVVRRHGKRQTVAVRPRYSAHYHEMLVGFQEGFDPLTERYSLGGAAKATVSEMWRVTTDTVSTIAQIFKSKERRQLQGVVGAYRVTQQAISQSTSQSLWIIGLISLSLGIINLFPFLPLDGGHIFWALTEKLRGKRVSFRVIERASLIGIGLVLILFVIGMTNSINSLSH